MVVIVRVVFIILRTGIMIFKQGLKQVNLKYMVKTRKANTAELPPNFDESKMERIEEYSAAGKDLALSRSIIGMGILLIYLFSGAFGKTLEWTGSLTDSFMLNGFILLAGISLIVRFWNIPFQLYNTFRIEKEFGFNTQTLKLWTRDFIMQTILSLILQALLLIPLLALIAWLPFWWWLPGFGVVACIQIVFIFLYPVLIAPLFNTFEPLEDGTLKDKLTAVCAKAGLKVSGVFTIDGSKRSRHSNAYFTGLGRSKRIVLYDTLIETMTEDEIAAVFAHEAGHWKCKHVLKSLGSMLGFTLICFYISAVLMQQNWFYEMFFTSPASELRFGALYLLEICEPLLLFWLTPIFFWIQRKAEYEADRMAVDYGYGPEMQQALTKLFDENLSSLFPHPWFVAFNYSHPPFLLRQAALQKQISAAKTSS